MAKLLNNEILIITIGGKMPDKQKPRQKILFIEDDEMLVRAYQNKFALEGFEVDVVSDGLEAILKLGSNNYDLILLDLILPKVNGFDVLKQLRTSGWPAAKKPVIVFSNLGDATDIDKAKQLGANDYLVKANLSPDQVVKKIREHLK